MRAWCYGCEAQILSRFCEDEEQGRTTCEKKRASSKHAVDSSQLGFSLGFGWGRRETQVSRV